MAKRMVSAQAFPGDTKEALLRALSRGASFDVHVTDPLVLGSGAFDIQDLDDTLVLKITDSTKRGWMLLVERVDDKVSAKDAA